MAVGSEGNLLMDCGSEEPLVIVDRSVRAPYIRAGSEVLLATIDGKIRFLVLGVRSEELLLNSVRGGKSWVMVIGRGRIFLVVGTVIASVLKVLMGQRGRTSIVGRLVIGVRVAERRDRKRSRPGVLRAISRVQMTKVWLFAQEARRKCASCIARRIYAMPT